MNCLVCNITMADGAYYSRCPDCGLVKSHHPANYDLNEYTDKYHKLFGTDMEIRIDVNRVATVMRHLPLNSTVLDYGCSCGNFIARLEKYGYRCLGYEPCEGSARAKTCYSCIASKVEDIDGRFDAITMFDVFEHFEDPGETFGAIDQHVKQGGVVIINTPSPKNVKDPSTWYHFWPGQHIYFWTPEALGAFMGNLGYALIEENYLESTLRKNDPTPEVLLTMVFRKKQ